MPRLNILTVACHDVRALIQDQTFCLTEPLFLYKITHRRPKFIFLVWLGSGVGMMKKARVAIQKADVMRLTGARTATNPAPAAL